MATCKECANFETCAMWNYSFDPCPLFNEGSADNGEPEKETARVCGRMPCTVKYKSRFMLSCPDPMRCAMRSRWKSNEQEAIKDWNNTIQERMENRGT